MHCACSPEPRTWLAVHALMGELRAAREALTVEEPTRIAHGPVHSLNRIGSTICLSRILTCRATSTSASAPHPLCAYDALRWMTRTSGTHLLIVSGSELIASTTEPSAVCDKHKRRER